MKKSDSIITRLLDLIAPRTCVVCGRRLSPGEESLCAPCLLHLPRTGFWLHPTDNPMARLFWGLVPVERVAALFFYEPQSETAEAIYQLKYHDHPEVAESFGVLMARELLPSDFFQGIDALVPVPLTRRRERQRGYNQSREIARGIASVTGLPVSDRLVSRQRFTQSQTQMHYRDRQDNVEGVFRLDRPDDASHRHLLLVDDIVTTGATMTACARALCQAPGVTISILSLGLTRS